MLGDKNMRCKHSLLLGCMVATVLLFQSGCQRPAAEGPAVTDSNRPGPKITFEKIVHDWGEVGQRTKKTCEFRFTNTGNGLLKIPKVEGCCGMTAESDKQEYRPGESGVVKVVYQVGSQPGPVTARLYVYTNDWARQTVALTVTAKVVQMIELEPNKLGLSLNKENAGCPAIKLRSRDGRPFALTGFKSTGDCITAELDPSAQATEFVLQPVVDVERAQKNLNGSIDISVTHPECGGVTIPFEVLPRFTVNPSMIFVFKAKQREPVTRSLLVLNNYGEEFEVESTSSKNGFVKVLAQKQVRNGYEFELEITPPDAKDKSNFADELVVSIKGRDPLLIACRGFYY